MRSWGDVTLGQLAHGLSRYRPFALAVAVVALVGLVAPGTSRPGATSGPADGATAVAATDPDLAGGGTGAAAEAGGGGGESTIDAASGATSDGATSAAGGRFSAGASRVAPAAGLSAANPLDAPDCDRVTGRLKMPTRFAPPCLVAWPKGADNGGATFRGVTKDTITVAIRFDPDPNPAVAATLVAAGAEDTQEQVRATRQGWLDYFQAHHETYGRKVKIVYLPMSGDDEAAAKADAVKVATEIKAFAAWGGSSAYREELTARGVVCICAGRDAKYFTDRAPYLWGTQPTWEGWLGPPAEYIGKRLWDKNAKHARDPVFQQAKRKFGIVFAEPATTQAVNHQAVSYMEREMAKYGARFADKISYLSDINTAQEQARVIIARLKDRGITTVVFWGDPLAPIFLTQEATRQNYFPEWMIVGGNLVDTTFFGRTWDPAQTPQFFGVSQLWARGPQADNDVFFQYNWHHGRAPEAKATYEILYQEPWQFMTALHLAGPKLTPQTYRDGLWSFPPSGGGPTTPKRSFGRHGLWPFDDYTAFDDTTEVWWDPNAVGENEIGQNGRGMWRYVDGGKRHTFGSWPRTEPKLFVQEGSVTKYAELPPEDRYPKYEHKHYRGT